MSGTSWRLVKALSKDAFLKLRPKKHLGDSVDNEDGEPIDLGDTYGNRKPVTRVWPAVVAIC